MANPWAIEEAVPSLGFPDTSPWHSSGIRARIANELLKGPESEPNLGRRRDPESAVNATMSRHYLGVVGAY